LGFSFQSAAKQNFCPGKASTLLNGPAPKIRREKESSYWAARSAIRFSGEASKYSVAPMPAALSSQILPIFLLISLRLSSPVTRGEEGRLGRILRHKIRLG